MRDHPLHFQYQDGRPFWFFGEKAWRIFQRDPAERLDHTSAIHHVDVRTEQGFNCLHTELAGTGGLTSGGNEGGEMFLDAGKEVINPAFFREVDSRLCRINEKGMICGMVLLYAQVQRCGDPTGSRPGPSTGPRGETGPGPRNRFRSTGWAAVRVSRWQPRTGN
jgi:hypothetical protein